MTKDLLNSCKVSNILETIVENTSDQAIRFAEISRYDYKNNQYILNKYFRNHIGNRCAYANLFHVWEDSNLPEDKRNNYNLHKILKKDFGCKVILLGYDSDLEHYRYEDLFIQNEYDEDRWRFKDDNRNELRIQDFYNNCQVLNLDNFNKLSKLIYRAVQQRLVIFLNLEDIPGILNKALDISLHSEDCSYINNLIVNKINEITELCNNKEVRKWLDNKVTDMSLYTDELMLSDYIQTYQKVIKSLFNISQEDFSYIKELIHNDLDLFEEQILNNLYVEFVEVYTNQLDIDELDEPEYVLEVC
jgi:DNA-binding ferritin-like protein (Dps family)